MAPGTAPWSAVRLLLPFVCRRQKKEKQQKIGEYHKKRRTHTNRGQREISAIDRSLYPLYARFLKYLGLSYFRFVIARYPAA